MTKRRTSISSAIEILEANALEIITVSEWANELGLSRAYFSRSFKREFGLSPKDFLKDFRLKLVKVEIQKDPKAKGYSIAVNCGFIDEKALHKYLDSHFDLCLSKVKAQVK